MLHLRDTEELDSQTINKMVNETFPMVIKVSHILFLFLFRILAITRLTFCVVSVQLLHDLTTMCALVLKYAKIAGN